MEPLINNEEVIAGRYVRSNEIIHNAVVHKQRSVEENNNDGFYFEECERVENRHPAGDIYMFGDWGYVCVNGWYWYRFDWQQYFCKLN